MSGSEQPFEAITADTEVRQPQGRRVMNVQKQAQKLLDFAAALGFTVQAFEVSGLTVKLAMYHSLTYEAAIQRAADAVGRWPDWKKGTADSTVPESEQRRGTK